MKRTIGVRNWLTNLGLLVASVTVALLLAEVGLRLFSPGYSPLFLDVYRMDGNGLVLLQPNVKRRYVTDEWRVTVTSNADGLRDYATPRPDSGGTVLGIGDSFAFGWGVELEEGFLAQAEERLRAHAIRIVKAGMPGAGPSDYLRFLEHYGTHYAPDLVVVSVFVGNDFSDVLHGGIPGQFTVRDGLMVKASVDDEKPSLWYRAKERLKRSSLLAQQVAQGVWYLQQLSRPQDRQHPGLKARDPWLGEFIKVHLRVSSPETDSAFALARSTLDGMNAWCREHQARLMLLVIPTSFQIYEWERRRWQAAFSLTDADLDLDRPQHVLADWAAGRGVAVLDLLPAFRAHAAAHPDTRLFFYPNGHMNAAGHALAGRLVAEWVGDALTPVHRASSQSHP